VLRRLLGGRRPLPGEERNGMDMTGEERIALSREAVWAALNDIDVLKRCIPGCQSLERQSDTDMAARVKLTIGPVSATFSGKVKLSDLDPPNGYRIAGEGTGGAAGYARGHAVVRLREDGAATLLQYEAKADVGGKLAQLGGRLIDATARKLAGEFFRNFSAVVAPAAPEPAVEAGPPPAERPKKTGLLKRWFRKKGDAAGGS
jgi:carbon monoxide dehydrogenase subunit G